MNRSAISRRAFLRATTTMSALGWSSLIRGENPSHRIRVGVIGTGVRGKYLIGNLPKSAQVTAICDCAISRMADTLKPKEKFAEVLADFRSHQAAHCRTYQDNRRLFDTEKLDAVIVATPDHHHVQAAMHALQVGLDVYLEKPISVTIGEGRRLADMVKKTGRVLQVGSQQRTMEVNRFACEFVRDGGLGKVTRVDGPNYPSPIADSDFPSESIPDGLDWDLFVGPTPSRPHIRKLWVWHKQTPRPEGSFSDASRFRPVTMAYADGTVLNFLPDVNTATFYGERGTMTISRNKFVADPVDLVSHGPDSAVAAKWEGGGHVARQLQVA